MKKRYLRSVPSDPLTRSDKTWRTLPPPDVKLGRVYDVKSGAKGKGSNGTEYAQW